MEFTAQFIADYFKGEVIGNPGAKVTKPARIEEGKPGCLCFLANPKYEKYLYTTKASVVMVNKDLAITQEVSATIVKVDNAYQAIATMLNLFSQQKDLYKGRKWGAKVAWTAKVGKDVYIGSTAIVERRAKIGKGAKIFPQVYVGYGAEIGENTILYPGVKVYAGCKIGNNCIIHAGTVIGSDGFGFAPDENNVYKKIPQLGNVVIEDDVELGANCTIDRATMGSTVIRKGAKLDNLVHLAHNVEIGENTVIAAQCGIAGSAKIGRNNMFGGQVGVVGHISLADGTKVGAQAGVSNTIEKEGMTLLGSPAVDISETRKSMVIYRKLPELRNKVLEIEKQLAKLTKA